MSAQTALNYVGLLSNSWLGNAAERGAVRLLRPGAQTNRVGGVTLLPQGGVGWTEIPLGTEYTILEATTRQPSGDDPLQIDPGGDRVGQTIQCWFPASVGVRTAQMVSEQDADVVQYRGASFRVMRGLVDPDEAKLNSVTAVRFQPRNLPPGLPAPP